MKKDKEWLREEVGEIVEFDLDHRFGIMSDKYVPLYKLCKLIDQLEEPEITDQTISKKETVEVPQFIADRISKSKESDLTLYGGFTQATGEVANWLFEGRYKTERVELFSRAWLDGYTIEKEPRWIVKRGNGDYVDHFSGALYELNINVTSSLDATAPYKFTDKSKADAVALLIDGTVELIEGWKGNERAAKQALRRNDSQRH